MTTLGINLDFTFLKLQTFFTNISTEKTISILVSFLNEFLKCSYLVTASCSAVRGRLGEERHVLCSVNSALLPCSICKEKQTLVQSFVLFMLPELTSHMVSLQTTAGSHVGKLWFITAHGFDVKDSNLNLRGRHRFKPRNLNNIYVCLSSGPPPTMISRVHCLRHSLSASSCESMPCSLLQYSLMSSMYRRWPIVAPFLQQYT